MYLPSVSALFPLSSDIPEAWSRREELNTPSADYYSVALSLSYTGLIKSIFLKLSRDEPNCPQSSRCSNWPTKTSIKILVASGVRSYTSYTCSGPAIPPQLDQQLAALPSLLRRSSQGELSTPALNSAFGTIRKAIERKRTNKLIS